MLRTRIQTLGAIQAGRGRSISRKARSTMTDNKLELELPPFLATDSVDTESERKDSEFNTSVVYSCCYYG